MTTIAIHLDGGLIHDIGTIGGESVRVIILDYDVDGADLDDLTAVPQDNGDTKDAYVTVYPYTDRWEGVVGEWLRGGGTVAIT